MDDSSLFQWKPPIATWIGCAALEDTYLLRRQLLLASGWRRSDAKPCIPDGYGLVTARNRKGHVGGPYGTTQKFPVAEGQQGPLRSDMQTFMNCAPAGPSDSVRFLGIKLRARAPHYRSPLRGQQTRVAGISVGAGSRGGAAPYIRTRGLGGYKSGLQEFAIPSWIEKEIMNPDLVVGGAHVCIYASTKCAPILREDERSPPVKLWLGGLKSCFERCQSFRLKIIRVRRVEGRATVEEGWATTRKMQTRNNLGRGKDLRGLMSGRHDWDVRGNLNLDLVRTGVLECFTLD
ncbi:hypothetical protein DFH09DRAFT_1099875 [Mycena vulgaris]|nr:hypothetical protein DFH09DRAFT_1099875 [Mycena vulgaris]